MFESELLELLFFVVFCADVAFAAFVVELPLFFFFVVLGAAVVVGAAVEVGSASLVVVDAAVVAIVDVILVCGCVSTGFEFKSQLERATMAAPTAIVSEITLIISLLFKDISSTPRKYVYSYASVFLLYCKYELFVNKYFHIFAHFSKNMQNALMLIPKFAPL